jgi:hypothetical protein
MDDLTSAQERDFLAHLEDDGRRQLLRDHLLSVSRAAHDLNWPQDDTVQTPEDS